MSISHKRYMADFWKLDLPTRGAIEILHKGADKTFFRFQILGEQALTDQELRQLRDILGEILAMRERGK